MSKLNIKGRCRIELTDIKTGRKEVEEHDNMLTKALYYFYDQAGMTNPSAFNASELRSNALYQLLGGVMCLDTALTESDEIVRVPSGIHMTANGARDVVNNTNPSELGTYNDLESGWQQDGSLKMVWDWTQSQGNGDIKAVCLSSRYGGMLGIGNKSSQTYKTNAINPNIYNSGAISLEGVQGIPVAFKDNVIYCVQTFYGVTEWTVRKYRLPLTVIDVRDSITARFLEEVTVQIPAEIQNLVNSSGGAGMAETYFQKGNVGVIYIGKKHDENGYPTVFFDNDNPAYIIKYDVSTGTVTAQVLNTTNTGISLPRVAQNAIYYGASDEYAVIGNNIVELANLANVRTITGLPDYQRLSENADYSLEIVTSDTFRANSGGAYFIDGNSATGYPCNEYSRIGARGAISTNPLIMFASTYFVRDPRYIATIFNLSSPVTKTADKTMKVTYILRFN